MKKLVLLVLCLVLAMSTVAYAEVIASDAMAESGIPDEATSRKMDAMLPAMDSVLLSIDMEDAGAYDATNADCVWTALYLMGVNWPDALPGSFYEDSSVVIPAANMALYARAAFASLEALPQVPESLSEMAKYDAARDAYVLSGSDRGDSYTRVDAFTVNDDGSVSATINMYGYGEDGGEELWGGMDMLLVPDDQATDASVFCYRIASIS